MADSASSGNGAKRPVSRRGFIELAFTAGLGLVALESSPRIAWAAGESGAQGGSLSRDGVKARFFIGSDLHMRNVGGSSSKPNFEGTEVRDNDKKLLFAFDVAYQLDPDLDAFCLVGDLTDDGRLDQYNKVLRLIKDPRNVGYVTGRKSGGKTQMILCQGNHETYDLRGQDDHYNKARDRFEQVTGQKANQYVEVNGVPVITMGPNGSNDNYYRNNLDFFKQTVAEHVGSSRAPFVVLTHHQIQGTTYTSQEWYGNYGTDLVNEMKAHPNLIHVSGHSHATTEDERSIGQDFGFTAIQDGTIGAYYENETGKVDPDSGEGASKPPQNSDVFTPGGAKVPEATQAIVLDVLENGAARAYRISLVRSKAEGGIVRLYDPWEIDVPGLMDGQDSARTFTSARHSEHAPVFTEGQVTVDDVTASSAKVHFPTAKPGSEKNCDMVHEYKLTATPEGDGTPVTRRVFHDYYRPTQYVRSSWDVLFKGLRPKTTYTMSVVAQTSWNKEPGSEGAGSWKGGTTAENSTSAALVSAAFTTLELKKPRAIFDIDYRLGVTTDAMGHTPNRNGGPTVVDDPDLGAKAFQSDGKQAWGYMLEKSEYDFFVDESTTECYFKLVDNQKDQCLFSNQQSAGAGFEVENGNLEFWYNSDKGLAKPSVAVETGTWVHAMAVADGSNVTLFVNGKQVAQKAGGTMKVPKPRRYYVGGDPDNSDPGQPQLLAVAGTRIAIARLYPRAFTADEVEAAYAAALAKPEVPEKVLDIDYRGGSAEDAAKHALAQKGGALVDDAELGAKAFEADGKGGFAYQLAEGDYAFITAHSTTECFFKLPAGANLAEAADHCLFSNQQGAGSGLQVRGGKLQFYFYDSAAGAYVIPQTDAVAGSWVHAAATFDGKNVTLYVNGKQVDQRAAKGAMKVPAPKVYYVGCDTNAGGEPQGPVWTGTRIALARLYTKALSADEVAEAYKAVTGAMKPAETKPLLNVDFRRRSAKDWAAGHTLNRSHYSGGTRMDKKLRQPVAMMDGKGGLGYDLTADDYAALKGGFAMELLFRVPSTPDGWHALFDNVQTDGMGLYLGGASQAAGEGNVLVFDVKAGNTSKKVTYGGIAAGTWYHVVAVNDNRGANGTAGMTLYVNGGEPTTSPDAQEVGSQETSNTIYVGAETSPNNGAPELPAVRNTAIAFARIYGRPLSAEQAAQLYQKSGLAGK